jgi:hypothetical protein
MCQSHFPNFAHPLVHICSRRLILTRRSTAAAMSLSTQSLSAESHPAELRFTAACSSTVTRATSVPRNSNPAYSRQPPLCGRCECAWIRPFCGHGDGKKGYQGVRDRGGAVCVLCSDLFVYVLIPSNSHHYPCPLIGDATRCPQQELCRWIRQTPCRRPRIRDEWLVQVRSSLFSLHFSFPTNILPGRAYVPL